MMNQSQLVWRCRRGVRELDVLFTRFLESHYANLSEPQQATFQRLLEVQDPVIMDWLFGKYPADDEELMALIAQLQELSGLGN